METSSTRTRTGFWSTQTLRSHLPNIVSNFDEEQAKEACYRLRMGDEYYVTASLAEFNEARHSARRLKSTECLVIPPGHFAFLQTLETVTMPPNALGFLSIRTRDKFYGLVNISGFHVDPGSDGKIIFAVFNAGPNPVHVRQGDPIFRLWIADLDEEDEAPRTGKLPERIPVDHINGIAAPLDSLQSMSKELEKIKINQKYLIALVLALLAATVGVLWQSL